LKSVRDENRRLRELVLRDDLTCLYNLRYFNSALETEHSRSVRFGRRYSLLFMDLDGLREVNSRHGHLAGGRVLKQLGEYLNTNLRSIDISARVGGDEFVVICPETTKESARLIAGRIRQGIEALKIHERDTEQGITASVGVAAYPDDGGTPKEILRRADQALYAAKAKGKNCVCCWGDFPADPEAKLFSGSVHSNQVDDPPEDN
jgi:diguanylate cyclase (GGDEF)-like protein